MMSLQNKRHKNQSDSKFRQWYESDSKLAQFTRTHYRAFYHFLVTGKRDFLDLAGNEGVIFLAGSGRSGTTWVQLLINYQHDHRMIFEPFWPKRVRFVPYFKPYLREDEPAPAFRQATQRIFQGHFRNRWTDRRNQRRIYRKRLIKDIRAHLFLKWLHHHFPSTKIVFLMRHPCAVVSSRLRLKLPLHKKELPHIFKQKPLLDDFLAPFLPLVQEYQEPFEAHILLWAIQNYVPLQQFKTGELFLLFYEELCQQPEAILPRLFDFLELPLKANVFETFHRPSYMARRQSAIVTGGSLIDSWREHVTPEQIKNACRILSHFGLDLIYSEESMPCS